MTLPVTMKIYPRHIQDKRADDTSPMRLVWFGCHNVQMTQFHHLNCTKLPDRSNPCHKSQNTVISMYEIV